jgi:hypothetical protein
MSNKNIIREALEKAKECSNIAVNTGEMSRREHQEYNSAFAAALAELDQEEGQVDAREVIAYCSDSGSGVSLGPLPDRGIIYPLVRQAAPPAPVDLSEILEAGDAMAKFIREAFDLEDIMATTKHETNWTAVTAKHRKP